jgi:CIC family chloride channel protein
MYGLSGGLVAVGFQLAINWVFQMGLVRLSHQSMTVFAAGSFAILTCSALLVGWLLNTFCREAAGSGIPQVKLNFWKEFGALPWRVAWVKFLAGVVSIGGGSSLGREGPSVHIAAATASNLAAVTGEPKQNRRAASAAGAAAGLAAAFNTPLAATTFVLEEIIGDLNSRLLGGVLLASVLGALVVHGIVGRQPSFTLPDVNAPSWVGYVLTPVVAALASVVGVYFQKSSLWLRLQMKTHRPAPPWLMPLGGALVTWVLGVFIFWRTGRMGIFSLGYGDLSSALAGDIGWQIAAMLLLAKFVATFSCYGFWGSGGIFSPTLFFGGMTGVIVAGLLSLEWPVSRADALTLSVVGMSACLGAVVWAPVTGILIVFEMTHEFSLVPALMIGALVSQAISRMMNHENFYEALLTQDGHRIEHVRPPRDLQSWQQLPVSTIANFQPVVIQSLDKAQIQAVLKANPYERYPVVKDDKIEGMLSRAEAELAIAQNRQPKLEPATVCLPGQTVRELQNLLIGSGVTIVAVAQEPGGKLLGIVTLHDLLRAEVAKAASSMED